MGKDTFYSAMFSPQVLLNLHCLGFKEKTEHPSPTKIKMSLLHEHCCHGGLTQSIQAKLELSKGNQMAAIHEC